MVILEEFVDLEASVGKVFHTAGVITITQYTVCYYLQGWLNNRVAAERDVIMNLFEASFPDLLRFALQNLTFKMDVLEAFIIKQACDLLQGLLPHHADRELGAVGREHYERLYVFALMWSIGAFLELEDRMKMEEFLRRHESIRLDLPVIESGTESSMFDYMVESTGNLNAIILELRNCLLKRSYDWHDF